MRATSLVILVAGLLAGCSPGESAPTPAGSSDTCTTGYSSQLTIHLSPADNGSSVSTHLCYAIDVLLVGPPAGQWQTVQTSDETTVAIVPLPLPAPPPGGTHEVYLAKHIGKAFLSSETPRLACPPAIGSTAMCSYRSWGVSITVVA